MTLIGKIFETEKEIDAQEREIENLCMKLLLHEHPVAGDLRSYFRSAEDDLRYGTHR